MSPTAGRLAQHVDDDRVLRIGRRRRRAPFHVVAAQVDRVRQVVMVGLVRYRAAVIDLNQPPRRPRRDVGDRAVEIIREVGMPQALDAVIHWLGNRESGVGSRKNQKSPCGLSCYSRFPIPDSLTALAVIPEHPPAADGVRDEHGPLGRRRRAGVVSVDHLRFVGVV